MAKVGELFVPRPVVRGSVALTAFRDPVRGPRPLRPRAGWWGVFVRSGAGVFGWVVVEVGAWWCSQGAAGWGGDLKGLFRGQLRVPAGLVEQRVVFRAEQTQVVDIGRSAVTVPFVEVVCFGPRAGLWHPGNAQCRSLATSARR